MRIECLRLERYGSFTDRKLTFRRDASLHVVLGPNESGKTTALTAIADLLFGFGHQTEYDFQHDGKALRIGADLLLADGQMLSLRRRKGNKNTLVDAKDQPLPDDLLTSLTGSVTRETFCREFGLTAEALRKGGEDLLKTGGRLAEALAAGSAGLSALSHLRAKLCEEADALFTPRKSAGKAFYVAADRHELAERKLRDAIVTREALQSAEARIAEAESQKDSRTEEHETTGRELARLQRCARTRNALRKLDVLELAQKEHSDLPAVLPQIVTVWRQAHDDDRDAAHAIRGLDDDDARDVAAIDALGVDEIVLACGPAIDALRERLGAIRKAMDDLPKRLEARRNATAELDDLARRIGLSSHEVMLSRRPADPALARVRDLARARMLADDRFCEAEGRLRKAISEQDEVQTRIGLAAHATDPAVFRQRLDSVASVPGDSERLRRESLECDAENQSLVDTARSLNPRVESLEWLSSLPTPDESDIAAHARALDEQADCERAARTAETAVTQLIESATTEIARLTREGIHATLSDLQAIRNRRNAAFDKLHAALDSDQVSRHANLSETRMLTRDADGVTDQLLNDSERATLKQAAEARLTEALRQREAMMDKIKALEKRRFEIDTAWRHLWSPARLEPHPPAEMMKWRQRIQVILERRDSLLSRRVALAAVAQNLDQNRAAIAKLMENFGRKAEPGLAAELLYREAGGWLKDLQEAWTAARELDFALKAAAGNVKEAEAAVSNARDEIAAIRALWPTAVAAVGLAEAASVAEANAALEVWQGVGEPKSRLERETRSVEGIEQDIASFNQDVAAIATQASAGFEVGGAQALLMRMVKALETARTAAGHRNGLRQAITNRKSSRANLQAKRNSCVSTLADARQRLGVFDSASLDTAIGRLETRQKMESDRAEATIALTDIADGLDEAALRAEQSTIDPDLLPGEIQRLKLQEGELLNAISGVSAELAEARRDYDTLAKGRDALAAARERAEAATEILTIARRWVVRASAARLASRAIERHRTAVQDPLLARAGALFSVATTGGFIGLAVDYDEEDRPALVMVRNSGDHVSVGGLSEGTRDQLFLALRLALLELRTSESLPFIADDLLSSFDESRTLRMLELLRDFGQRCQTIVFTHHAHVADIAKRSVPQSDVMSL